MVDTSAIYALLDKSDANHNDAVKLLKTIVMEKKDAILTNFIVAETHALIFVEKMASDLFILPDTINMI